MDVIRSAVTPIGGRIDGHQASLGGDGHLIAQARVHDVLANQHLVGEGSVYIRRVQQGHAELDSPPQRRSHFLRIDIGDGVGPGHGHTTESDLTHGEVTQASLLHEGSL